MSATEPDDYTARAVLRHLRSLGYRVAYFRLGASLRGTVPASVECQAVELPSGAQWVAKVVIEADGLEAAERACAVELARMVGVELARMVGVELWE